MGDLIKFPGQTTLDIPVEKVLEGAAHADLEGVVIMGMTKSGEEYFAASYGDPLVTFWMAARLQRLMHKMADGKVGP